MKLYAITTSERASKGQGGNEYLKTVIKTENGNLELCIHIENINGVYIMTIYDYEVKRNVYQRALKLKGKSQKGEKLSKCCNATIRYLNCDDCKQKGEICNEIICTECGASC